MPAPKARASLLFLQISLQNFAIEGDLNDLPKSGRAYSPIGDVQFSIGSKGHGRGQVQAGRDEMSCAVGIDPDDYAKTGG